jgi:hypothetical protein
MGQGLKASAVMAIAVVTFVGSPALADCNAFLAQARAAADALAVSIQGADGAKVGNPIKVAWRDSAHHPAQDMLYFVVTTPADVRFSGRGFMALAAGAKGPRGLAYGAEGARALVPLHRKTGAAEEGEISIVPYRRGTQQIAWAVVTAGGCGEHVFKQAQRQIDVAAGSPTIVVQDRFATGAPKQRIRSLSGKYDLLIFAGHYEVDNVATGAKIVDRPGVDPNFSPTGRFIAARRPTDDRFELLDLASGEPVDLGANQVTDGLIAWARGDSYVVITGMVNGDIQIRNVLVEGGVVLNHGAHDCKNCTVWSGDQVIIDVDRGFAAIGTASSAAIADLSDRAEEPPAVDMNSDDGLRLAMEAMQRQDAATSREPLRTIRQSFDSSYPAFPRLWDLGEKLVLSHIPKPNYSSTYTAGDRAAQARFLLHHPAMVDVRPTAASESAQLHGRPRSGRGSLDSRFIPATLVASAGSDKPASVAAEVVFERIAAAGIVTTAATKPDRIYVDLRRGAQFDIRTDKLAGTIVKQIQDQAVAARNLVKTNRSCGADDVSIDPAHVLQVWRWRDGVVEFWLLQTICAAGSSAYPYLQLILVRGGTPGSAIDLMDLLRKDQNDDLGEHADANLLRARVSRVSDGLIAIAVPGWQVAAVIDVRSGKRVARLDLDDGGLFAELRLTPDRGHVVQLNGDGRFFVHRAEDGVRVLTGACGRRDRRCDRRGPL